MILAVASGKGGTGKTTVSASLVSIWDRPVTAVDLDVEEPNLHLFLNPELTESERVDMAVPVVDESRCTKCGACSELCQFRAITLMAGMIMVFPELCHGCGGCQAVCPENCVGSGARELGVIESGTAGDVPFIMGRLRVGEAMSPPLMRAVKKRLGAGMGNGGGDVIIDAPPGVSCPAMAAVMDADMVLLVTEPTPFGFHDFKLAWEAFSGLGKPMAAVINRAGLSFTSVHDFCREKSIPILCEIPYDRSIAQGYSQGRVVASLSPELRRTFEALRDGARRLYEEAAHA